MLPTITIEWRTRSRFLTERLDTVIERSDAERETFIAEIREIWRYLRYQPGNGRSGHDDA
ncbi:MAG: hypothetical protein DSM106950_45075 [Stigonema ocellatum SAG 48.90 = DSM 106950]|nr:hypothetical protein [Stigonema ocellatum SAG 48.90 = DSM 106950]